VGIAGWRLGDAAAAALAFLVAAAGFGARCGATDAVLKLASLRACAAASTPPRP